MVPRPKSNYSNASLGAAIILIAALTLVPAPQQAAASALTPWYCLICGDRGLVDVLLNIALFVPFGLALGHRGIRPSRVTLIALLGSAAIELAQATLVPGRDASLSDVLTNTAGALAGAILASCLGTLWRPTVSRARQLALGGAAAWLALLAVTGIALQPDRASKPTRLLVAPPEPLLDTFRGTVHRVEPDSVPEIMQTLAVTAMVTTAGLTERLAPVVELRDSNRYPIARLGQLGQKPVFERRLLATRWRLRTPTVFAYGGAIPADPARATLAGGYRSATLWTEADVGGHRYRNELRLTPGSGWMLVLPLRYPFDRWQAWTAGIWLAVPLLLVGFWSGRAGFGAVATGAGAIMLMGLGLEGMAALFGLARDGSVAWMLGLLAVMAGWGTERAAIFTRKHENTNEV